MRASWLRKQIFPQPRLILLLAFPRRRIVLDILTHWRMFYPVRLICISLVAHTLSLLALSASFIFLGIVTARSPAQAIANLHLAERQSGSKLYYPVFEARHGARPSDYDTISASLPRPPIWS